ncbi:MAG: transporter substrate-binding domain-containing protein [SAR324 cluster bacterium]|nr:transporter substrate-binding domain-containing protein [SAR324 cluster bacterium]
MIVKKSLIIFSIMCCIIGVFPSIGASETKKILINFSPWEPFEYTENKIQKGIDLEIVKAVLEKNGFEVTFKMYPWARAYELAKQGKADGVFSMGKRPEREVHFVFPAEPLIITGWYLYFPREKVVPFKKDLKALKDLRIGTVKSYNYGPDFMDSKLFIREDNINDISNLRMLKAGHLDAVVCDSINCQLLLKKEQMDDLFVMYTETPIDIIPMYVGFSKNSKVLKQYPDLVKNFSQSLKQMKDRGAIDKIAEKYGIQYLR